MGKLPLSHANLLLFGPRGVICEGVQRRHALCAGPLAGAARLHLVLLKSWALTTSSLNSVFHDLFHLILLYGGVISI